MLDYGYPQNCSLDVLKMYINLGSQRAPTSAQEDRKMTSTITGARDWRREGIVHKKNEVFLDVLESVNLLLSTTGTVLRNDVTGVVRAGCSSSSSSCRGLLKCCHVPPRPAPPLPGCHESRPLWHARVQARPQRQTRP